MQQKERADHSHHQEFFLKFIRKVVHGALDELAAVIGSDYFHALGQTFLQLSQFFTHGVDDRAGVFARTQQHNAARHLALAVKLHQAPAHFRAKTHRGHLLQIDGRAVGGGFEHDLAKIVQTLQITARAHHIFGLGLLDDGAAGLLVGLAHSAGNSAQGDVVLRQLHWVRNDLVFLDHAAHRSHLGHAGHGGQLKLKHPVLQRAQLGQVVFAAFVHQGVFINPADARGVRPQGGRHAIGQPPLHLVQVFQHTAAGPVEVCLVVKNDVDI